MVHYTGEERKMIREEWKKWEGSAKDFNEYIGKRIGRSPVSISLLRQRLGITAWVARSTKKTKKGIAQKRSRTFNYCPDCGYELKEKVQELHA